MNSTLLASGIADLSGRLADVKVLHDRRKIQESLHLKQVSRFEAALSDALEPLFERQILSAQEALKSNVTVLTEKAQRPHDVDSISSSIFNPRDWDEELTNRALPVLMKEAASAMWLQLRMMGVDTKKVKNAIKTSTATEWLANGGGFNPGDFVFLTPYGLVSMEILTEMPDWMVRAVRDLTNETFAQDYWSKINDSSLEVIKDYVYRGVRDGWSIERMAAEMAAVLIDDERRAKIRGRNIARTESGHLLNGARVASIDSVSQDLQAAGVPVRKMWMSVLGSTTRATHADLDGVPADKDGLWSLGGVKVRWPGDVVLSPGERCNCQCTVTVAWGMTDPTALSLIGDYQERLIAQERSLGRMIFKNKVFCPTGPGGGVDPTCSPGGKGGGDLITGMDVPSIRSEIESVSRGLSSKLRGYSAEYESEGDPSKASITAEAANHLESGRYAEAANTLNESDVRYDIPTTVTAVRRVSEEATSEFNPAMESVLARMPMNENGQRTGLVTDHGPLELTMYRVGDVDSGASSKSVFFGATRSDVAGYESLHEGQSTRSFSAKLESPVIAGHQNDLTQAWFGKSYSQMMDQYQSRYGSQGASAGTSAFDKKVMTEAVRRGHDSIIYLSPAPPARTEIAVAASRVNQVVSVQDDSKTYPARSKDQFTEKVFCPTGPGGGIDPTCSPGGSRFGPRSSNDIRSLEDLRSFSSKLEGDNLFTHATRSDGQLEQIVKEGIRPGRNGEVSSTDTRSPVGGQVDSQGVRDLGHGYVVFDGGDLPRREKIDVVSASESYAETAFEVTIPPGNIVKIVRMVTDSTGFRIREDDLAKFALANQGLDSSEVRSLPAEYQSWFNLESTDLKGVALSTAMRRISFKNKVFCPTGPGGGVDPTCSPGGNGRGESGVASISEESYPAAFNGNLPTALSTFRDTLDPRFISYKIEQSRESGVNELRSSLEGTRFDEMLKIAQDDSLLTTQSKTLYFGTDVASREFVSKGARYMTSDPERAKRYAGEAGTVVEVHVPAGTRMWTTEVAGLREFVTLPGTKIVDGELVSDGTDHILMLAQTLDAIDRELGARKVFCPTGTGGGVDPTCSPGEKGPPPQKDSEGNFVPGTMGKASGIDTSDWDPKNSNAQWGMAKIAKMEALVEAGDWDAFAKTEYKDFANYNKLGKHTKAVVDAYNTHKANKAAKDAAAELEKQKIEALKNVPLPPVAKSKTAQAWQPNFDAIYQASQTGDISKVEAIATKPSTSDYYSDKLHTYKQSVLASMQAGGQATAPLPKTKSTAPKIDAASLPKAPKFLDKNYAAGNEAICNEILNKAKNGDVAGLKSMKLPPSQKVKEFHSKVLNNVASQLAPPPPKISSSDSLESIASKVSSAKANQNGLKKVGHWAVLADVEGAPSGIPEGFDLNSLPILEMSGYWKNGADAVSAAKMKTRVQSYTGEGYVDMNSRLRNGTATSNSDEVKLGMALVNNGVDLPSGLRLYRLHKNSENMGDLRVGSVVADGALLSTSTKRSSTVQPTHTQWVLTVGGGVKGFPVKNYSHYPEENETLLPPNQKIIITHIESSGGSSVVYGTVMPTEPNQCC